MNVEGADYLVLQTTAMKSKGPIIIIEDDQDDQDMFIAVFKELAYPNEVVVLHNGVEAIAYLRRKDINPFIVISDINMPVTNGIVLREQIKNDPQIHVKCTPYLFFSTSTSPKTVSEAYCQSIQGFFKKENSIAELKKTLKLVMDYWNRCLSPQNY